jgi:dTDP-4-amino-4,6-dideoxy-D-galactose acyltransferase
MIFKNKNWQYYSSFSFSRSFSDQELLDDVISKLKDCKVLEIESNESLFHFYYKLLSWDSNFFSRPTYRIEFVDYDNCSYSNLKEAVRLFLEKTFEINDYYSFEIPPEDTLLIQAYNENGFRLNETRLVHYLNTSDLEIIEGRTTRLAKKTDTARLGLTAQTMINSFDRVHADPYISDQLANSYLKTYAEECVNGYVDEVIVPGETGIPVDSFVALKYLALENSKISQIVLSAVSNQTNKGWYIELIKSAINRSIQNQCSYVFNTTQATNKAVCHTLEKLDFKLGRTTHLLVKS